MARNWIISPKEREKGKIKIYSEAKSDQRVLFLFFFQEFRGVGGLLGLATRSLKSKLKSWLGDGGYAGGGGGRRRAVRGLHNTQRASSWQGVDFARRYVSYALLLPLRC